MAIASAVCTSFKVELLKGIHNFSSSGGDTFNLALYTSSASLGAATTAYTTSEEVSGSGYTAKGNALTSVTPVASSTTAVCDFSDTSFTSASFTARGCMIFNDTASGDPSCVTIDFGSDKTVTSGTFTIQFPTADSSNAIIRIA